MEESLVEDVKKSEIKKEPIVRILGPVRPRNVHKRQSRGVGIRASSLKTKRAGQLARLMCVYLGNVT